LCGHYEMFEKMRRGQNPAAIPRHFEYQPDFLEKTHTELTSGLNLKIAQQNDWKAQQRNRDPQEPGNHPFRRFLS
jgi:hypothetical protein